MKGLDICQEHNKPFEYVCVDHNQLCCSKCVIVLHRRCNEVNVKQTEVRKEKENLCDTTSVITELQTCARLLSGNLEEIDNRLAGQLDPILELIESTKQAIVSNFDDLKMNVTREFTKTKEKVSTGNKSKLVLIKNIEDKLQCSATVMLSVREHGTDEQKCIAARAIRGQSIPYGSSFEQQRAELYKLDVSIEYSDELTKLLKSGKEVATFHINKVPVYSDTHVHAIGTTMELKYIDLKTVGEDTKEPLNSDQT